MDFLQINLFEKFELKCTSLALTSFRSSKALELFCYLLLHRNRSYLRETLAETLWGQDSSDQSKKMMRQTIWEIQSLLKTHLAGCDLSLLSVSANRIQINPELSYVLDVAEFERAFTQTQGIPISNFSRPQIEALQKAETLYRGDLLEGCYWDWCVEEREHYQDLYLMLLEKLMVSAEISQQYELGMEYGTRILNYDRAFEPAHQHLMRLYYLAGHRIKALRQFERCTAILNQELGVGPSQQTLCLYEQIKADKLDLTTPVRPQP